MRLPGDLVVREDGLADPVRDTVFPLNWSGRFVLAHADGRTIAEIAGRLAVASRAPPDAALMDALSFCTEQNGRLLLNVELRWGTPARWLATVARTAPHGLLPPFPRRRVPVPSAGAWQALLGVGGVAACLAAAAALALLTAAGVVAPLAAVVAGLSVGGGLVLHEGGHAAMLRGVPCCLALAGLSVAVLHRPLAPVRRRTVALAGPLAGTLGGGVVLAAAWFLSLEEAALGAAPLTAQALGLTVLAGDGRTACGLS